MFRISALLMVAMAGCGGGGGGTTQSPDEVDAQYEGPIGSSDVVFMPSPVTHITGAYWVFDIPWVSGATSVLLDVWTADEGIDCIEKDRCTVTGGATPFLRQLLDTAVRHGRKVG